MVANAQKKWTVEEYLAFERSSEEKHEYFDGHVFPVGQPHPVLSWQESLISFPSRRDSPYNGLSNGHAWRNRT